MRQIKFRAWDTEENKFFEPIYKAYAGELLDLSISLGGDLQRRTLEHCAEHVSRFPERYILEQFLNKKDKNRVEIYEGDIVKMSIENDFDDFKGEVIGQVKMFPSIGVCVWKGKFRDLNKDLWIDAYPYKKIASYRSEVIGNIHKNPELLNLGQS